MATLRHAYVTGWAVRLPGAPVDNARIEAVLGAVPNQSAAVKRRVLLNNGIQSRHYAIDPATGAPTHTNASLTAEAVRELVQGFGVREIEVLACGTSSPDQYIPSHASMVHAELAAPPMEILSPSGVCCSGLSALKYGYLAVASGSAATAVVTGSELASPALRAEHFVGQTTPLQPDESSPMLPFSNEFLRWMLSDGAGALLISDRPAAGGRLSLRIDWVDILSFAAQSEVCMYYGVEKQPGGGTASFRNVHDGAELMRRGFLSLGQDVRVLADKLPALLMEAGSRIKAKRGLTADGIDWLLPHFSSMFFRQKLFDGFGKIGLPIAEEKWFTNLATKGNTGSAALYIMIEELMNSGRVKRGQRILGLVPESSRMIFGFVHFTVV